MTYAQVSMRHFSDSTGAVTVAVQSKDRALADARGNDAATVVKG